MKQEQDYVRDIAEIRSMMERSSRFLSLSGWAGILSGVYALAGAYIAYRFLGFDTHVLFANTYSDTVFDRLQQLVILALLVLLLSVGSAVWLSAGKAKKRNEKLWNTTSRQLLNSMAVPLVTGGLLMLLLIGKGYLGLIIPCSLLFYGLALFNAGRFTYKEVKTLGYIQLLLGLTSAAAPGYGLLCWVTGFGIMHIVYGIYIHYKYEK